MDSTTSAVLNNIAGNLEILKSYNVPFYLNAGFWGSIIASITALYIAIDNAKTIKRFFGIRPNLIILGFRPYNQGAKYWRLAIKNTGSEVAKSVQVDVTQIKDDNIIRMNFLPVQLRWTHLNSTIRDILPKQTVYLDCIEIDETTIQAHLSTPNSGGISDFKDIKLGLTSLRLNIFTENDKTYESAIELNWTSGPFHDGRISGKKWHKTKDGKFLHKDK